MTGPTAEPPRVEILGEVSAEDIAAALPVNRSIGRISKVVAILLAALAALVYADTMSHRHEKVDGVINDERQLREGVPATEQEQREQLELACGLAVTAAGALMFAFLYPRRAWRPYEILGSTIRRTITSDGIEIDDTGARGFIPWESVRSRASSDGVCVLHLRTPPSALIFPERMFADRQQWNRFCALVETHVP